MIESELIAALAQRAEEFTLQVFPGARPAKNCLWINDDLQVFTAGIRSGRWRDSDGNGGTLLDLYAVREQISDTEAMRRCARFLGLVAPVEELEPEWAPAVDAEPEPLPEYRESADLRAKVSYVPDIHRLLPQSQDAELGLLGSVLLSPREVMGECVEKDVSSGYFHVPAHATIFEILRELYDAHKPIDFILLTQLLRDRKLLEKVGGPAFVTSLFTFVPTAANSGYYIEILREKFVARRLIVACNEYAKKAYDECEDQDTSLEELQGTIKGLQFQGVINHDLDELSELSVHELMEFDQRNDPNCLLGNRWLCKGGAILWVGSAGLGKSSMVIQAAMKWGCGSSLWGIRPARELKSLIIQAENDKGDLGEMVQGVMKALLQDVESESDRRDFIAGFNEQLVFVRDTIHTSRSFARVLAKLIRKHKPDLVWIDPLLSFAGGDISKQEVASDFLRNQLNPVLLDSGVGLMVAHHTGKPEKDAKAKAHWTEHDMSYAAFGSSELVNWARGVNILSSKGDGNFELRLGKRGKRAGAKDLHDEFTEVINLRHGETGIYWKQVDAPTSYEPERDDESGKFERLYAEEQILAAMEQKGRTYKWHPGELQKFCLTKFGISKATFYRKWGVLILSGKLAKDAGQDTFSLD